MHLAKRIALLVVAAFFALGATTCAQKPSFDVVSIKPSALGRGPRGGSPRGDRIVMTKVTLKSLLQNAYPPTPGTSRQLDIVGGLPWMDMDLFDIEAKADCSNGPIDRARYTLMIQSMLEDRFQLKAHTEPREVPIYELLLVAKDGLKLKPSTDQTPINTGGPNPPVLCLPPPSTPPPASPPPTPKVRGFFSFEYAPGAVTVIGNAVQIKLLIIVVATDSGRPVIDKTNLKELYDFKFQFSPDRWSTPPPRPNDGTPTAASDPVPTLATAIQQLGLKLESVKAPIDVLVVESAQKPKEN